MWISSKSSGVKMDYMDIQATPPHPEVVLEDEIREIPNLENTPPAQEPIIKTPDLSKYETAAKQDSTYNNAADSREEGRLTTEEGGGGSKPQHS